MALIVACQAEVKLNEAAAMQTEKVSSAPTAGRRCQDAGEFLCFGIEACTADVDDLGARP
jgi:hypothetical protein